MENVTFLTGKFLQFTKWEKTCYFNEFPRAEFFTNMLSMISSCSALIPEQLAWKLLVLNSFQVFSSSNILWFFAGQVCEENINECSSSPCLNKGTCVDGLAGYHCLCEKGYIGKMFPFFQQCLKSPGKHHKLLHLLTLHILMLIFLIL